MSREQQERDDLVQCEVCGEMVVDPNVSHQALLGGVVVTCGRIRRSRQVENDTRGTDDPA